MQTPLSLALYLMGRGNKTGTGLTISSYASSFDPGLIRTEDMAEDLIRPHPCWPRIDSVVPRLYASHMKTTFAIDEMVMKELREEAAWRRAAVSTLVEAGLRHVLVGGKPADGKPAALPPLPTWRSGGFRVDIDSREALYRMMEEK